jgi:ABC-type Fe3+ transport system permease subunit
VRTYLRNALIREAPYVGAAVSATALGGCTLAGVSEGTIAVVATITAAWVAVYVRSVSTPREAADQRVEEAAQAARDQALAAVAALALPSKQARPRKATQGAAKRPGGKR